MISLSDLTDPLLRTAKSGNWWENTGHRALANNSWVVEQRPDVSVFLSEWKALYDSHSGERGVFSRSASRKKAAENGRRIAERDFGTNPCSEIILRPKQCCNLTECVVRAEDTVQDLQRKIRLATYLGTFQSTLTNFRYLSDKWKENCEEERLLGVSLTGIMDNTLLNNAYYPELPKLLRHLRSVAVAANEDMAGKLGIPVSTAITCTKPSGTVSQLVDSASGIHPRYAPYYIRTVRADAKDPLTAFMKDQGIPWEPCVMRPAETVVFSFPIKSPEGSIFRDDLSALDALKLWKIYADNWCEHKPSVTVEYAPDEFMAIGAWLWENLDSCSGVSFLPRTEHVYKQAPYQPCDELTYAELLARMPSKIDWSGLSNYETEDSTDGVATMACSAGACEIVDVKR